MPLNAEAKSEAKSGAPEKYEAFTVPEGYELDTKVAEEAGTLFKEAGLTQAQAQKLVDLYSKHSLESSQAALKAVKDMQDSWADQTRKLFPDAFDAQGRVRSDSKLLVDFGRMLDSLGDTKLANDFRHAMDLTGAGFHPAFIQVMHRLSQHFAEGTPVRGSGPSPHGQSSTGQQARKSAAQEMYPNLPTAG